MKQCIMRRSSWSAAVSMGALVACTAKTAPEPPWERFVRDASIPDVAVDGGPTPLDAWRDAADADDAGDADVGVPPDADASTSVAPPTVSVPTGEYSSVQLVTLTSTTAGAILYYTTDGSSPGAQGKRYESKIFIGRTTTLRAVAILGDGASAVTSTEMVATYTLYGPQHGRPRIPTFSPPNLVVADAEATVQLSGLDAGTIMFARGDQITRFSEYEGGIAIPRATTTTIPHTITAYTRSADNSTSLYARATYIAYPAAVAAPTAIPASGTYSSSDAGPALEVTLSSATADTEIWYTRSGRAPSPKDKFGIFYDGNPITITTTSVLLAVAVPKGGGTFVGPESTVMRELYVVDRSVAQPAIGGGFCTRKEDCDSGYCSKMWPEPGAPGGAQGRCMNTCAVLDEPCDFFLSLGTLNWRTDPSTPPMKNSFVGWCAQNPDLSGDAPGRTCMPRCWLDPTRTRVEHACPTGSACKLIDVDHGEASYWGHCVPVCESDADCASGSTCQPDGVCASGRPAMNKQPGETCDPKLDTECGRCARASDAAAVGWCSQTCLTGALHDSPRSCPVNLQCVTSVTAPEFSATDRQLGLPAGLAGDCVPSSAACSTLAPGAAPTTMHADTVGGVCMPGR